jgi:tRNA(adenine34) deaminase
MIEKKFSPYYHESIMQIALEKAKEAGVQDEVPIGAALFVPGLNEIISYGNQTRHLSMITAHAEILCLQDACKKTQNYRLNGSIMYLTLEPCLMCLGALLQARVSKVFIAAKDSRTCSIHRSINLFDSHFFNHKIECQYGLGQLESEQLLKEFFDGKRQKK